MKPSRFKFVRSKASDGTWAVRIRFKFELHRGTYESVGLNLPMPKGRGFLLIESITGLLVGCSSPELSSLVASYKRRRQPLPQFHQR